jgi:hypothetical protein
MTVEITSSIFSRTSAGTSKWNYIYIKKKDLNKILCNISGRGVDFFPFVVILVSENDVSIFEFVRCPFADGNIAKHDVDLIGGGGGGWEWYCWIKSGELL